MRRPTHETIVMILIIIWLPLGVAFSFYHVKYTALVCHLFQGKTESEKTRALERGIFDTLAACREKTPDDAEILIVPPREKNIRKFAYDYYFYPRKITWYEKREIDEIVGKCKKDDIGYYIVLKGGGAPVVQRVE